MSRLPRARRWHIRTGRWNWRDQTTRCTRYPQADHGSNSVGGCSLRPAAGKPPGRKGPLDGGALAAVSLSLIGQPAPAFGHVKKHFLGDQVARGRRHGFGFPGPSTEIFRSEDIQPATILTNKWFPNPIWYTSRVN